MQHNMWYTEVKNHISEQSCRIEDTVNNPSPIKIGKSLTHLVGLSTQVKIPLKTKLCKIFILKSIDHIENYSVGLSIDLKKPAGIKFKSFFH